MDNQRDTEIGAELSELPTSEPSKPLAPVPDKGAELESLAQLSTLVPKASHQLARELNDVKTNAAKTSAQNKETSTEASHPPVHRTLSLSERLALVSKRRECKQFLKIGHRLLARGKKTVAQPNLDKASEALKNLKKNLGTDDLTLLDDALKNAETTVGRQLRSVKKSTSREVLESLVFALIFAMILRTFFIEPFKIPTRSMVPTLLDGDRLFVTKLSYGIRMPFLNDYVVWFSKPQRGEVVVFSFPQKEASEHLARSNYQCMKAEAIAGEKDYIKRIIGVEGDSIEVIDQVVHVNGEPIAQQAIYQRDVPDYFYLSDRRREIWNRETHGDAQYTTITHSIALNHFGPIKVAPGNIFVMGDNRDNSSDSRCWGQVPMKNIKGRAQVLWWSAGSHGPRWTRVFTRIH